MEFEEEDMDVDDKTEAQVRAIQCTSLTFTFDLTIAVAQQLFVATRVKNLKSLFVATHDHY